MSGIKTQKNGNTLVKGGKRYRVAGNYAHVKVSKTRAQQLEAKKSYSKLDQHDFVTKGYKAKKPNTYLNLKSDSCKTVVRRKKKDGEVTQYTRANPGGCKPIRRTIRRIEKAQDRKIIKK